MVKLPERSPCAPVLYAEIKKINLFHYVWSTDLILISFLKLITCLLAGIHRSFGGTSIAAMSTGRVTQVIGAVVDVQVII